MSLSYEYEFRAPANKTPLALASFLHRVEIAAQRMGFGPTAVLNVPFDTPERAEFSRRLGAGFRVHDNRLKNTAPAGALRYSREEGACSVAPLCGVVLVITNERGDEACFGFMLYPEVVLSPEREPVAETRLNGQWAFRDSVQSPDQRYRDLVALFARAGYLHRAIDEFAPELP